MPWWIHLDYLDYQEPPRTTNYQDRKSKKRSYGVPRGSFPKILWEFPRIRRKNHQTLQGAPRRTPKNLHASVRLTFWDPSLGLPLDTLLFFLVCTIRVCSLKIWWDFLLVSLRRALGIEVTRED
jgi:hypothetical protein